MVESCKKSCYLYYRRFGKSILAKEWTWKLIKISLNKFIIRHDSFQVNAKGISTKAFCKLHWIINRIQ
jgi:hypothetical protein